MLPLETKGKKSDPSTKSSKKSSRRRQNATAAALAARNAQKMREAVYKVDKAERDFAANERLLLASMIGPSYKYITTGMYTGHYRLDLSLENHRRCLDGLEERGRIVMGAKSWKKTRLRLMNMRLSLVKWKYWPLYGPHVVM